MVIHTHALCRIKENPPGRRIGRRDRRRPDGFILQQWRFLAKPSNCSGYVTHTANQRQVWQNRKFARHDRHKIRTAGRSRHPLDQLLPFACGPSIRRFFIFIIILVDYRPDRPISIFRIRPFVYYGNIFRFGFYQKARNLPTAPPQPVTKTQQTGPFPACRESQEPPARPRARHP